MNHLNGMTTSSDLDVLNTQVMGHGEAVYNAVNFFMQQIKFLSDKCIDLDHKLQAKTLDHESEVIQRRELQKERNMSNEVLKKNNYAILLVDGDGMIFRDDILRKGGKEAGRLLLQHTKSAIRDYFHDEPGSGNWKVQIKIFASVDKLADVIYQATSFRGFREFVTEFNQADPFLMFVDVGHGKEITDDRIKSHLHWNLDNFNCRAVFLAASHDNGYARDLSTIITHERDRRVVLVEGPPFAREFLNLGYRNIAWHDLFLNEKLVVPAPAPYRTAASPPTPPGFSQTFAPMASPALSTASTVASRPTQSYAKTAVQASPVSASPVISAGVLVRKQSEPRPEETPTAVEQNSEPKPLTFRKTPSMPPAPEIYEYIKKLSPRPCNDKYLRGQCTRVACAYGHEARLSERVIEGLRYFARQNRCQYGVHCYVTSCVHGHGCKAPLNDDGTCTKKVCNFPISEHPGRDEYQ